MPESSQRLESWKQIAAHLDKSERAVRRWSETEGLPVHKHQHRQKGSVWAYTDEIEVWLEQRRISPPAPTAPSSRPERSRYRIAIAVGVVAVFVAVVTSWRPSSGIGSPAPLTFTPVTGLTGRVSGPSFSPDGNLVAFAWSADDSTSDHIYIKRIGSTQLVPLTTGPATDTYPVWMPDGKTIVFCREDGGGAAIYSVPSVGGPVTRVVRMSEKPLFPRKFRRSFLPLARGGFLISAPVGNRPRSIARITADGAIQPLNIKASP